MACPFDATIQHERVVNRDFHTALRPPSRTSRLIILVSSPNGQVFVAIPVPRKTEPARPRHRRARLGEELSGAATQVST